MRPFWVRFERSEEPTFLNLGVGVTAHSEDDARALVEAAFPGHRPASFVRVADVAELDQNHVVPNMGNLFVRGIWFPKIS